MNRLSLNFVNCYGIRKLKAELEFKRKGFAIYSPNGVMKTSFAKTMTDLAGGKQPCDLAFPLRKSVFEVKLNGQQLKSDEIFVVKSYDENYSSNEVSTLLADSELKSRYEAVHREIGEAKKALEIKLRILAGFGERSKENLDPIIESVFGDEYYDALFKLKAEIDSAVEESFWNANYKIIFDPKVAEFISDTSVTSDIEEYAKKYDELTEKSPILRRNFQYQNILQIQQNLETNNFFNAGHSLRLNDRNGSGKTDIDTDKSLLEKIEAEKERVINDSSLVKKFNTFNAKLKNKELQFFRDHIAENQHILKELRNPNEFKRKLWVQYIYKAREDFDRLISMYQIGKEELAVIVKEARSNPNDWDSVIKEFNLRFIHLPFQLVVVNKSDVILKGIAPSLGFKFVCGEEERVYAEKQKNDLLRVLSTGEARALYILNVMFEVYVRRKLNKKTLFVFDDIAESFDYKNKFAIVNYLQDVVNYDDSDFLTIILTHNFDFLRTIESRMICPADQCRMAFKNEEGIKLSDFKQSDIQNPFHRWQSRLAESVIQVAYIPFIRNLVEYTQGAKDKNGNDTADYLALTYMLHYKHQTEQLKLADYKKIFERTLLNVEFPDVDENITILSHIFATADQCLDASDGINLEQKIVLSMSIRIWTERYIIQEICKIDSSYDPAKKQAGQLIGKYKAQFSERAEDIDIMKRVNLITPSNIHINSFMYEPILDMGFDELKRLYQDVKSNLISDSVS
ncbi:hypothetical protein D0C16_21145 [Cellvibrio sp. KY-GH-1]|uniref:hypothetical protein n=1 Tax=Cellvibrio sp. KY-GH-1 TaxID=2303332 RepID=UPI001245F1E4|nr:hypothetical protein [Cellvibrio sp. KY-GH-1]QEY18271.1 hypothetical protein D0C16_21145 [Cellvibrio sp. KY-GH-1]